MKYDYKISLYQIETVDGLVWMAEYPELKYCAGSGLTAEEALSMAEEELPEYIEMLLSVGQTPPKPLGGNKKTYSGKFTIRVGKSTHERLDLAATEENVSINQYVNDAILDKIARDETCNILKQVQEKATTATNGLLNACGAICNATIRSSNNNFRRIMYGK